MNVLNIFEIVGTLAFAAAGALTGIQKKLDVFGVVMLALITAVGGGIVRDVLIGNTPPTAFMYPMFTIISLITAIVSCFTYQWLGRFNNLILFFDAIGLGAFTAAGANMAFAFELNRLFLVVMMGTLSGIGGGILRDVFVREIPFVFQKEVYALASIAGAVSLFYTKPYLAGNGPLYVCFFVTVVIRGLSMKYDVHLPVVGMKKSEQKEAGRGKP